MASPTTQTRFEAKIADVGITTADVFANIEVTRSLFGTSSLKTWASSRPNIVGKQGS